ncbi:hypothetical protein MAHJHV29_49650 [Mycobacterium avium subsp. hominissuis]
MVAVGLPAVARRPAAVPLLVLAAATMPSSSTAEATAKSVVREPGTASAFQMPPRLARLGGIWNADAVPGSRTTLFAVASAVLLLGMVAVGLPAVCPPIR